MRHRLLNSERQLHLGTDSSPGAQHDNQMEASSGHSMFVSCPHVELEGFTDDGLMGERP